MKIVILLLCLHRTNVLLETKWPSKYLILNLRPRNHLLIGDLEINIR